MGHIPKLLTFEQAAAELNVPKEALRAAADQHNKTIRIGRALRLDTDDLRELVRLCQGKPKALASSGETAAKQAGNPTGKSETDPSVSHVAQTIASSLKKSSRRT